MDSFNNIDPFKQFVKGKLADYNAKVPPSGWEKLESSLFAAHKAKVVRRRWLASTATVAAAALIGIFFVFQNMNRELPVQFSEHQTTKIKSVSKAKTIPFAKQKENKTHISTQSLTADNATSIKENALKAYSKSQIQEESPYEAINSDKKDVPPTPRKEDFLTKEDKNSEIDKETKRQLIEEFINEGNRPLTSSSDTNINKKKDRHSISLTGQSGLSSSQQTNTIPTTLRSSVSETYGSYTLSKMQTNKEEEVEIKPESQVHHMQPVSFGILTSYALSQKLQIETGVVYTYLSSETKNKSDNFHNSEKVQFHYLGVPINLNYTVASFNKLDLFATAGAMIEKDISGKIKSYDEKQAPALNNGYVSIISSKIKQNNPQFSVTGGVGITYPIYDKAQLFGKIGGRYYFNAKNEFKTYYSDEKFGLDIQLGIKFNF